MEDERAIVYFIAGNGFAEEVVNSSVIPTVGSICSIYSSRDAFGNYDKHGNERLKLRMEVRSVEYDYYTHGRSPETFSRSVRVIVKGDLIALAKDLIARSEGVRQAMIEEIE